MQRQVLPIVYLLACGGLLAASRSLVPDFWQFIDSVYLFSLRVDDLTPNIGLFWCALHVFVVSVSGLAHASGPRYFFLEVFQAYRLMFLYALHLHTFSYNFIFYFRLRSRPLLAFVTAVSVLTMFKTYAGARFLLALSR
jgi:hypothetical protein